MRISICLGGAVIALASVGCFSQSDPGTDITAAGPRERGTAPVNVPVWEAFGDTTLDAPDIAAAADPESDVDDFDLSDLDDIAPSLPTPKLGRPQPITAGKPGFASYRNDLSQPKSSFQIASRDAREPLARPSRSMQPPTTDPNLPTKIELREASKRDLNKIIDSFHGKIVFVDFWASWCGPCVGSFPNTIRMHRLAHQHDLRVITVSLDKPVNQKSVLRFLESHQATCVNLLAKSGGIQPLSYDFGIPGGSIPHFKLYDRQGTQRHDWTGAGPDVAKDIIRRVVELLNEM